MTSGPWLMSTSIIIIGLFKWNVVNAEVSAAECREGLEYFVKEGKCVPCTKCTHNSVTVRQCQIYQDAKCSPPKQIFDWPKPSKNGASSSKGKVNPSYKSGNEKNSSRKNERKNNLKRLKDKKIDPYYNSHGKFGRKGNERHIPSEEREKLKKLCSFLKNDRNKNRKKLRRFKCNNIDNNTDSLSQGSNKKKKKSNSNAFNDIKNVNKSSSKSKPESSIKVTTNIVSEKDESDLYFYILISAIFLVILLFFIIILVATCHFFKKCREERRRKKKQKLIELANSGFATLLPDVAQVPNGNNSLFTTTNLDTSNVETIGARTLPLNRKDKNTSSYNSTLPRNLGINVPSFAPRSNNSTPRVLRRNQSPNSECGVIGSHIDSSHVPVPTAFSNHSEVSSNTPSPFMDRLLEQRRVVGFTPSVENNLYVEMWKGPPTPVLPSRSQHNVESVPISRSRRFNQNQSPIVMRTFRRSNLPTNK